MGADQKDAGLAVHSVRFFGWVAAVGWLGLLGGAAVEASPVPEPVRGYVTALLMHLCLPTWWVSLLGSLAGAVCVARVGCRRLGVSCCAWLGLTLSFATLGVLWLCLLLSFCAALLN